MLAVRVSFAGAAPLHARLLADPDLRDKAEAAAQRCGDEVWLERLRIATTAPARRGDGAALAGLDLAAALGASADEPASRAAVEALIATIRAKLPGGALADSAAALDVDSVLAEARALTLGRAERA